MEDSMQGGLVIRLPNMTGKVELYSKGRYQMVREWYHARKLTPPDDKTFPTTGAIVPDVAAGFIYCTDGPFAILEGLVTNPLAPKGKRVRAVAQVVRRLVELARGRGYTKIIGFTKLGCVEAHALKTGFKALGAFTLLGRDL
jgi:hypothetical protein